ncbi:hypothetical protein NDU88_001980 [Pleurodeles waltl]|uniref:Uncharacterized protein n=1 Tax=Pleurodeles waltl TaxID=8319 RepID=A0AAV7Q591_PLEWA|nr:hypothetical protein NDU88_001980 [Pleurodeles waltl]
MKWHPGGKGNQKHSARHSDRARDNCRSLGEYKATHARLEYTRGEVGERQEMGKASRRHVRQHSSPKTRSRRVRAMKQ